MNTIIPELPRRVNKKKNSFGNHLYSNWADGFILFNCGVNQVFCKLDLDHSYSFKKSLLVSSVWYEIKFKCGEVFRILRRMYRPLTLLFPTVESKCLWGSCNLIWRGIVCITIWIWFPGTADSLFSSLLPIRKSS